MLVAGSGLQGRGEVGGEEVCCVCSCHPPAAQSHLSLILVRTNLKQQNSQLRVISCFSQQYRLNFQNQSIYFWISIRILQYVVSCTVYYRGGGNLNLWSGIEISGWFTVSVFIYRGWTPSNTDTDLNCQQGREKVRCYDDGEIFTPGRQSPRSQLLN